MPRSAHLPELPVSARTGGTARGTTRAVTLGSDRAKRCGLPAGRDGERSGPGQAPKSRIARNHPRPAESVGGRRRRDHLRDVTAALGAVDRRRRRRRRDNARPECPHRRRKSSLHVAPAYRTSRVRRRGTERSRHVGRTVNCTSVLTSRHARPFAQRATRSPTRACRSIRGDLRSVNRPIAAATSTRLDRWPVDCCAGQSDSARDRSRDGPPSVHFGPRPMRRARCPRETKHAATWTRADHPNRPIEPCAPGAPRTVPGWARRATLPPWLTPVMPDGRAAAFLPSAGRQPPGGRDGERAR